MNEKKNIVKFIQSIVNNDFKAANSSLQAVVTEKIKNRIRAANATLDNKK